MVRSDGDQRAYKLVGFALRGEYSEIGLTSTFALYLFLKNTILKTSHRDYDMHGPAGPTAFWKETDELTEEKTSSMPLAYF